MRALPARTGSRPLIRSQRGFNLIEVMVAVAVLAIGLLGIAALQVQGLRYNLGSYSRSQAVLIANDYAERMYANRRQIELGGYAGLDSNAVNCGTAPAPICGRQSNVATPAQCTPAQMAIYDRFVASCGYPISTGRYGGVRDLLVNGRLRVDCVNDAGAGIACANGVLHRILITWQESVSQADGTTGLGDATYQITVQP